MLYVRVPLGSWKAKATQHERALTILLLQVCGVARALCQMLGRASGAVAGFMHGLAGGRGERLYCCIALPSARLSLACMCVPVLQITNLSCKDIRGSVASSRARKGKESII